MDYKTHAGIDLHIHSNASDGSLSPAEIIKRAQALNLRAISITDHDTVEGSKVASEKPLPTSLKFLSGIEISASPPPEAHLSGSFHILGYGFHLDDLKLNQTLSRLQEARRNRNPQIIDRLNEMGFDLSIEELQDAFGKRQLGRPHIAQLMVKKGYAKSIDDAFDNYIGTGKPAFVNKFRLACSDAIDLIRNAGGVAVLAHPFLLNSKDGIGIDKIIAILKEMGLQGVEAYYPDHGAHETKQYEAIAKQYDLLVTGGTDFHGDINPDIEIGIGRGEFSVPIDLYEALVQYLSG